MSEKQIILLKLLVTHVKSFFCIFVHFDEA